MPTSNGRWLGGLRLLFVSVRQALCRSRWRNTTCSPITEPAFPGAWESNIYAPASRTVAPKSILSLATGEDISSYPGAAYLAGNGSNLVFNFGMDVGGIVTMQYTADGGSGGAVGLAFSGAKNWIGEWSDSSNGGFEGPDGAIYANFTGAGSFSYTMPDLRLRGGFRYLTLFPIATDAADAASVNVTDVSLEIGFIPTWSN